MGIAAIEGLVKVVTGGEGDGAAGEAMEVGMMKSSRFMGSD